MSAPKRYAQSIDGRNWQVYVEQNGTEISWTSLCVEEPVYGVGVVTNSPSITFPYKITGQSERILRDCIKGG